MERCLWVGWPPLADCGLVILSATGGSTVGPWRQLAPQGSLLSVGGGGREREKEKDWGWGGDREREREREIWKYSISSPARSLFSLRVNTADSGNPPPFFFVNPTPRIAPWEIMYVTETRFSLHPSTTCSVARAHIVAARWLTITRNYNPCKLWPACM